MKLDELIAKYIKLRDRKAQMKRAFEDEVGKVNAVMDKMEAIILKTFQETGQTSAKTEFGTAYTSARTSATVADRDAFMSWVMAEPEDRMVFLENRVSKTAVDQYKAANDDVPPGVSWSSELVVGVRRS
jgi:hypothetical protein